MTDLNKGQKIEDVIERVLDVAADCVCRHGNVANYEGIEKFPSFAKLFEIEGVKLSGMMEVAVKVFDSHLERAVKALNVILMARKAEALAEDVKKAFASTIFTAVITDEAAQQHIRKENKAALSAKAAKEAVLAEVAGEKHGYWNGKVYRGRDGSYCVYIADKRYTLTADQAEVLDA